MNENFSERYRIAPQPENKPDDYLPGWIREAAINEIQNFLNNPKLTALPIIDLYALLRSDNWQVLERQPPANPMGGALDDVYTADSPTMYMVAIL